MKNVIFDWSGTLMDNFSTVYEASMIIFDELGGKRISIEEYKEQNDAHYMVFWNKHFPELSQEKQNAMFANVIKQIPKPQLYPAVKNTLKTLYESKVKLIILSSQPSEELILRCRENNIHNYNIKIYGGVKDKKDTLPSILKENSLDPEQTLFVGDTVYDINVGKHYNMETLALTWGFQNRKQLENSKPDHIIDNINDLLKYI